MGFLSIEGSRVGVRALVRRFVQPHAVGSGYFKTSS